MTSSALFVRRRRLRWSGIVLVIANAFAAAASAGELRLVAVLGLWLAGLGLARLERL